MEFQPEEKTVKALWEVMAEEGLCDGYGARQYQRCRPLVVDFIKKIREYDVPTRTAETKQAGNPPPE